MIKPHFWRTWGYWNCRCDGFTGTGWTREDALEDMVRHRLWYRRMHGQELDIT